MGDPSVMSLSAARAPRTAWFRLMASDDMCGDRYRTEAAVDALEVDATFAGAGVWAGVEELVGHAYDEVLAWGRHDLVDRHGHELHMALPGRRAELQPRLCLTDTSPASEQTRLYPVDRPYRTIHGLVGFLLTWASLAPDRGPCVVMVRHLDKARHLGARFFIELARRAAADGRLQVTVESETRPDDGMLAELGVTALTDASASAWRPRVLGRARDRGTTVIEDRLGEASRSDIEMDCPIRVARHEAAGDDVAAAREALALLTVYNRYGYYHEGAEYIPLILRTFDALVGTDARSRLQCVKEMYACLISGGQADRGLELVSRLAIPYLRDPVSVADLDYLLGVHHIRHASRKDMALAERHLLRAVEGVRAARASYGPRDYVFRKVFTDNALALLRSRQGRHDEAVGLCQAGYSFITDALGTDSHKLHRSVLQYNSAQACLAGRRLDQALVYYANAVAMDPNYSEYHNEIGNICQEQERYDDALASYERAIACAPPYPEVYFNKAVCLARLGELEAALSCLAVSLDLNPRQPDGYVIRADILGELGRAADALRDYDRAIGLGADGIAVRVNRAAMLFRTAAYAEALADIDLVIAREPGNAEHLPRRAAIIAAMEGREPTDAVLEVAEGAMA